ncbi:hypothetical protein NUW58_g550 [Xylaria curta]|uniref:Uncharacterized protein n=1 Tax=Xylaria curta TaxID=42375 RepID=A0ACC1PQI1_9PEZI|nr:hypothetical protein NUW58_g550 [Xylaria curta]
MGVKLEDIKNSIEIFLGLGVLASLAVLWTKRSEIMRAFLHIARGRANQGDERIALEAIRQGARDEQVPHEDALHDPGDYNDGQDGYGQTTIDAANYY